METGWSDMCVCFSFEEIFYFILLFDLQKNTFSTTITQSFLKGFRTEGPTAQTDPVGDYRDPLSCKTTTTE